MPDESNGVQHISGYVEVNKRRNLKYLFSPSEHLHGDEMKWLTTLLY